MAEAAVARADIQQARESFVRPSLFWGTLRRCKLYDYERHRWLDLDGKPTGEELLQPSPAIRHRVREVVATAAE